MLGLEIVVVLGTAILLCAVAARRIDDTVLRQIQSKLDIEEVRLSRREVVE